MSKSPKNVSPLSPKLGEILGVKKIFPSNYRPTIFAYDLEIKLAKNPENLIKFYSIEVGQIEHFMCYPNG